MCVYWEERRTRTKPRGSYYTGMDRKRKDLMRRLSSHDKWGSRKTKKKLGSRGQVKNVS
jgi:predicted GIY-YIG superfamily endonuclease